MLNKGMSVTMIIVSVLTVLITGYYIAVLLCEVVKGKRTFRFGGRKGILTLCIAIVLMGTVSYCLYQAPYILFGGQSWLFIWEWGPTALIYAVICLAVVIPVICLYCLLNFFFYKENDKPYFMTVVLSILSAIGNSVVVFIINQALNMASSNESRTAAVESGLYIYFILGIALFTICALIVRKILIEITSNIIYEKRMDIIHRVLQLSFEKIEGIRDGRILSILNNDTENISNFVNDFVNGLTGILTLITCYIYLGTQNLWGMFSSLLLVLAAVYLFLAVSRKAEEKYEKNRDVQDTFFSCINAMLGGFKELSLNAGKKKEFSEDIEESCHEYRRTRTEGQTAFLGVSMMGEVLYIAVIGIIVFIFPLLFPQLRNTTMRNYVTVYLYMGGIINSEIYLVPGLMRIIVSYRRITQFMNEFQDVSEPETNQSPLKTDRDAEDLEIRLEKVEYQYEGGTDGGFLVGPISCSFKSGEITFISGGNGSGKSTLAKIVTGLYRPQKGKILINGKEETPFYLRNLYSAIFSDYFLFDRMYGIDHERCQERADTYLKKMGIDKKVQIKEGTVNSKDLSTGQRKRLALVLTYLEDRRILLFDEWAADQDPEFRRFFYEELLPELKRAGKIIIAITHDDKYFFVADKHFKMEYGKLKTIKGSSI